MGQTEGHGKHNVVALIVSVLVMDNPQCDYQVRVEQPDALTL